MSETTNRVELVPYNSAWQSWFDLLAERIYSAVPHDDISIEHFGSTSIEGLLAKPRIDIVIVYDYTDFETIKTDLHIIGYTHNGDLGVEGREVFKLQNEVDRLSLPTHNLYACHMDAPELRRILLFRDKLRQSKQLQLQYQDLKIKLASRYPDDINAYAAGKSEFVQKVLTLNID